MNDSPREPRDLAPASMHFQILLLGTVIFLSVLYWLTGQPNVNLVAIQALGCYMAFVSVVLGHKVLCGKSRSTSQD